MIDAYTKAVLTVIALALAVLAVRPMVAPSPALALSPTEVQVMGWYWSRPIQVECVSGCQ